MIEGYLTFKNKIFQFLGFRGKNCEENIDDCPGNLCENGATCIDIINGYTCACPPRFTGEFCGEDVDECSIRPSVCQNGATCTNTFGNLFIFFIHKSKLEVGLISIYYNTFFHVFMIQNQYLKNSKFHVFL